MDNSIAPARARCEHCVLEYILFVLLFLHMGYQESLNDSSAAFFFIFYFIIFFIIMCILSGPLRGNLSGPLWGNFSGPLQNRGNFSGSLF